LHGEKPAILINKILGHSFEVRLLYCRHPLCSATNEVEDGILH
jgi:hypothetical protein